MCSVQRVTNSCGHINDHVSMSCYIANEAAAQEAKNPLAKANLNETDKIQRYGFDARNKPYCKSKEPKALASPKGFQCMVAGCGKAD
jgi:hypothetical protein